ncbi:MAG: hypothetical protein RH982_06540 [Parvibaculum sp.]
MTGDRFSGRQQRHFSAWILVPVLLFCAPGTGAAAPSSTAPMSSAEYEAARAFLAETRAAIAEAAAALEDGQAQETRSKDVKSRSEELGALLDRLRATMVEAAKRDRIGARGSPRNEIVTPERRRARCVVAEAGALEDRLQDLWTLWSMRARGAPQADEFAPAPEGPRGAACW